MRKSFNTLSALVQGDMGMRMDKDSAYLFLNKRATHLKVLCWEGDGLSIYYKRLEAGTFERMEGGSDYRISYANLVLMLAGISVKKVVKRKRYKP